MEGVRTGKDGGGRLEEGVRVGKRWGREGGG